MQVHDLRSALKLLEEMPGQLVSTDVEVDPPQSFPVFTAMWVQAAPSCAPPRSAARP